jgi:HlyD family secretion protein
MTGVDRISRRAARFAALLALTALPAGCTDPDPDVFQGYVEGEYVYVAAPLAGALDTLSVRRGMQVAEGDPLFALDRTAEQAARDEAERRLVQARATLEDARKGKRPTEIEALKAQLKQARAALNLAEREFARHEALMKVPGATAELEFDRARSARDQHRQRVAELEAELHTAQLGSRLDLVIAAEAEVRAREAVLARAEWDLAQKRQRAPKGGLVFDTLYREGEWVPAGRPVVVLLPPQYIKVRAFVPQTRIGTIRLGDRASVSVDGVAQPFIGEVSFISPRVEYTPPVIYSRESRDKLVVMIEVTFDPHVVTGLHPGQPVDVRVGT